MVPRLSGLSLSFFFFFFNDPAPTEIYTLSLHDALPISASAHRARSADSRTTAWRSLRRAARPTARPSRTSDRKSTRLNSSHMSISYAVFCLKKKKKQTKVHRQFTPADSTARATVELRNH